MKDLVEHIWPKIVGDEHCGHVAKVVTIDRDDLRTAIRATLEYARDNVSENMVVTGRLADDVLGKFVDGVLGHTDPREAVEGIFRAMITTLLAELDGTESEGR